MADKTEIAWTDSTFNPWWGCTKVSPGCDNCYAAAIDNRIGGDHWGPKAQMKFMSEKYWEDPLKWQRKLEGTNETRKVFCGSMCDVFDKNGPEDLRARLWAMIKATPNLNWLLLTKRAGNIEKYLPEDWGDGYHNVWLGVTVENREHGLPRLETLRNIPAAVRFLSMEPLLGHLGEIDLTGIHWVIVGGESGPGARPMENSWLWHVYAQCYIQDVPFFFKQWGASKGKGGCLIEGSEIKQWPRQAA